jgi:hypothetical protein
MFCCEYIKNLQSFFKGANHSHICSALEPIKDHVHKSSQLEQKILLCCNKKSDFFGTWPKKNKSTLSFFLLSESRRHLIQIFLVMSFPIHRCIVDNYNPRNSHVKNNTMLMGCNSINVKFTSLSFIT